MSDNWRLPPPYSQFVPEALLYNPGHLDLNPKDFPPVPPPHPDNTQINKNMEMEDQTTNTTHTTELKSTTIRLDSVTLNQLDWIVQFLKHLGIPRASQRIAVSRAIELYVNHCEDLLITYGIRPRDRDVLTEQKALIVCSEIRPSPFKTGELPSVFNESDRMLGYRDLARKEKPRKIKKLPGVKWTAQEYADHLKKRKEEKALAKEEAKGNQ
jgi:hypothetical protein